MDITKAIKVSRCVVLVNDLRFACRQRSIFIRIVDYYNRGDTKIICEEMLVQVSLLFNGKPWNEISQRVDYVGLIGILVRTKFTRFTIR